MPFDYSPASLCVSFAPDSENLFCSRRTFPRGIRRTRFHQNMDESTTLEEHQEMTLLKYKKSSTFQKKKLVNPVPLAAGYRPLPEECPKKEGDELLP